MIITVSNTGYTEYVLNKQWKEYKPYTAVISDYTYMTYDNGTDTSATSRIDTLKNKVSYGTDSSNNVVSNYSFQYEYDDANNITYEYGVSLDGEKTLRYHYVYDRMNHLVRADDNISRKTYAVCAAEISV